MSTLDLFMVVNFLVFFSLAFFRTCSQVPPHVTKSVTRCINVLLWESVTVAYLKNITRGISLFLKDLTVSH